MGRRSDHTRDQLKILILDAAWAIVGREGFEGLTARRLAADIGYAPGTIYNLFQSMDDLYLQINARTLDQLHGVLSSPGCNDPRKTPVQNMKTMAAMYMEFAVARRLYWLMLFSHSLPDGRKLDDWYQAKIDRLFQPLENLLGPLFLEETDRKQIMAARLLWSSVHGLCFLQETGKIGLITGASPTEMSAYLIDTFVAGLRNASA